jgi:two-component system, OmpR family, response regulator
MFRADERVPAGVPVAVVVEDDPSVSDLLALTLRHAGFAPVVAATGIDGIDRVRALDPALVTVDIGLPDLDGLAVTRRLREFSSAYIVMVSSRAEEGDILGGLAAGADDYVAKPFRPRVLRSRFAAGLRRPRAWQAVPDGPPPPGPEQVEFQGEWIAFRGLRLDPGAGALLVDGRPVALGRLEFDLLELLLYGGDEVRTAGELALSLRGETYAADTSPIRASDLLLVDDAIQRLLATLGDHPDEPRWVRMLGEGRYRLA